jgi:AraC-like DNA-binding protein
VSPDEPEELLCYSARLIEVFARALRAEGKLPLQVTSLIEGIDPDQRVPIASVHQFLAAFDAVVPDPDLGLRASRQMTLGDGGALDYAMSSAPTLRDCLNVAARYMRLVNDAATVSVDVVKVEGERELALVRVRNQVELPRIALDFQLCALLWNHGQLWPEGMSDTLVVSFPYPAPADLSEYRLTLGGASLRFSASEFGFSFPAHYLDAPLRSTDAKLHGVMRSHVEWILGSLPKVRSLTDRLRALLIDELTRGEPSASRVARRLYMSKRTLGRRLEDEGTTFSLQLDALRKELALRYLQTGDLSIAEVALLTGFSSSGAFHRAFRRWTGDTPRSFRIASRQLFAPPVVRLSQPGPTRPEPDTTKKHLRTPQRTG